jgi:hypothetical protein
MVNKNTVAPPSCFSSKKERNFHSFRSCSFRAVKLKSNSFNKYANLHDTQESESMQVCACWLHIEKKISFNPLHKLEGRPADGGDGGEHGAGTGGHRCQQGRLHRRGEPPVRRPKRDAAPSAGYWDLGGVTDYSVYLVHKMANSQKKSSQVCTRYVSQCRIIPWQQKMAQ